MVNEPHCRPTTWAEVNLQAIAHNFKTLRRLAAGHYVKGPSPEESQIRRKFPPAMLAVVKADAYGHGMIEIARLLDGLGVDFFGVADIPEGVVLRRAGIRKPILLFESTLPDNVGYIVTHNLIPTLCTIDLAEALDKYAARAKRVADVHVKVDTGMGRLGVWHTEASSFIKRVMNYKNLSVKGLYTHFPVADSDRRFTGRQVEQLHSLVRELDRQAYIVPYVHAANSMGLAGYSSHLLNLVRPGLMLYGLHPHPPLKREIPLKPALSVKSRVMFVKEVEKGRGISYGHTYKTSRTTKIATLPVGYNDGYFRALSNKASVLIGGQRCPILGRVTMDQTMVDITKTGRVRPGQEAVLLGQQKKGTVSADDLASWAGTINYEIVCALGNRLPRVYV